ncbi:MAG TPA: glycosyltransferase family 4 protein [Limnochordia bacterium]
MEPDAAGQEGHRRQGKSVLFVLPYTEPAGTERHTLTLARGLLARGWRAALVAPPGGLLSAFIEAGLAHDPFPRLEQRPLTAIGRFRRALHAAITREAPDLIHIHGGHELIFLSRRVRSARHLPLVFTAHGYFSARPDLDYRLAAWTANRFADAVICVCHTEADRLARSGLRREKIRVVYNGIPDERAMHPKPSAGVSREALGLDPAATIIGGIGRLERQKGFDSLVEAFARVRAERPERKLQLVLVGAGSERTALQAYARAHGLADGEAIVFLGQRRDVPALLRQLDILAVPSRQEAFPLIVLEGMACGLPVVASSVGGIPEMITDGETGKLVPPERPAELAAAIGRLIDEPLLRRRIGAAARRRFEAEFTADRMVSRTEAVYGAVLGARAPMHVPQGAGSFSS